MDASKCFIILAVGWRQLLRAIQSLPADYGDGSVPVVMDRSHSAGEASPGYVCRTTLPSHHTVSRGEHIPTTACRTVAHSEHSQQKTWAKGNSHRLFHSEESPISPILLG